MKYRLIWPCALLVACTPDVSQTVDTKLLAADQAPDMPLVVELPKPQVVYTGYQAGKDPFASPYLKRVDSPKQDNDNKKPAESDDQIHTNDSQTVKAVQPQPIPEQTPANPNLNQTRFVGRVIQVDPNRQKSFLEAYELSSLKYKGRLIEKGQQVALVQSNDGGVHRVLVGQYLGKNQGRVLAIDERFIHIQEVYLGVDGRYYEQKAQLVFQ